MMRRHISDATRDEFRHVARLHLDRAYRLATLVLGRADDAEDATQEALERAWASAHSLKDSSDFQPWFDRILVNVCRDRLRRSRRIRFLSLEEEGRSIPSSDPLEASANTDEILRALEGLTLDERAVVILRFWADLQLDEIARRLGWPSGTVKSRLHRALGKMRTQLVDEQTWQEVPARWTS